MNSYERVRRTIEFEQPDRLPIAGNSMHYETHGDVIYHFPKVGGNAWWLGAGGDDEWGCRWETNRQDDMGQVVGHPLKEPGDFARLPRPNGLDADRYADLARELPDRPDAYHVFCNGPCVFERMHFLRGFDALLMDMATEPETVRAFAKWVIEYQKQTVEYLAGHFKGKVHALRCTDDLGTQQTSIISPALFREVLKPAYAEIAGLCHAHGLHFWLHSCGRIDGVLDDLVDAGVDVVNFFQPQVYPLKELGARFAGRITFECYPDVQQTVPTGDRARIRADIAQQLEYLATSKGGYIAINLEPKYLESECEINDPTLADFIVKTYRELDPWR